MKRSVLFMISGAAAGAVAGYLYYRFYGCGGSCTITSSPWRSCVYGAFMGALLGSIFVSDKRSKSQS